MRGRDPQGIRAGADRYGDGGRNASKRGHTGDSKGPGQIDSNPLVTAEANLSSPPPRLRMTGVHKRFGATIALSGVDLAVESGQVLALVGENGAGKSTLMKVLSGAHQPDEGAMWLDGEVYRPRDPLEARRRGVAMIYQELSLAGHLSVMENILLGVEPKWGPLVRWGQVRKRAGAAMRQ